MLACLGKKNLSLIDERATKHIFRNKQGHIADTPINRQLLENTASNPINFLGTDKYGNERYAKILPSGKQVWAQVRNGMIRNGGINQTPRQFNSQSGFSSPIMPGQL